MICPHCHKEVIPTKNGKVIDTKKSKIAGKTIKYQRYLCPKCFRQIKGEIIS